jgi:hypothetical protein
LSASLSKNCGQDECKNRYQAYPQSINKQKPLLSTELIFHNHFDFAIKNRLFHKTWLC